MTGERRTISDDLYDVVAEQEDGGGGYEWAQVALVRRVRDGQLFLVDEAGCSCNDPWTDTEDRDLTPVATWQEAIDRVKADVPYHFTDDDVARFAEKLMTLRPAPSAQMRRPEL